ncbi:carotenoid biosynthesis protein [Paenibacillus sp. y28]|uniref:carotenoid biosynthesis protein n=1 Tax=Paenibacillus sp. y28 TaxID=3129110 RepID=UPI00301894F1
MLTSGVPEWLSFSNGLFLVFFVLYALSLQFNPGEARWSTMLPILLVGVFTYGIEWIGVKYGWPFGSYVYTDVLGFAAGGVPFGIPCAWIGILITVVRMLSTTNRWLRALYTGGCTVVFDLVLDPVAFAREFWLWQEPGFFYGVPASNFISWFFIAALLSLLFPVEAVTRKTQLACVRLLQAMLLMFGLLAVKEGLVIPGLIALAGIAMAEGGLRFDRSGYKPMV